MCEDCNQVWKNPMVAQTRAVMTIREQFADLKFLMSKYKDIHMVLLFIGIQSVSKELVNEVFCFPKYNRIVVLRKESERSFSNF